MHEPEMDYSAAQVKGLIKRYRELRSAVQVVAMHHNQPAGGTGGLSGREDIICMLVDIEQAASSLTKRQQQVILLMISGYSNEDISSALNIRMPTVKFHYSQAIARITTYLNAAQAVRIKNGR